MAGQHAPNNGPAFARTLAKAPTGIQGFDEITGGGLPRGRTSLVCGSAGCGKTLFAMQFLVRGAAEFNEPGVFIAFEETPEELTQNVRSLGFDLEGLSAAGMFAADYIHIEPSEIQETGDYDLEGLFIRLGLAIDSIGAKRVVLDTIETLFGGFRDDGLLRAELRRLFRWLKEKGVTAVITAERGEGALTRQGLEEYVSDCVIILDHRVTEQISTRRLRIVKYRGSSHGANEFPFLIDDTGFVVLPVTSLQLAHEVSDERISSGVPRLDDMLGGRGFFRGSSVLISGASGTGKSSLGATFAHAAARRGERVLYFAYEESPAQIVRNMRSIGLDLAPHVASGLLSFHAARPAHHGLELHLAVMHKLIREFNPQVVVIDPITGFMNIGSMLEVQSMMLRTLDMLKSRGITSVMISLTGGGHAPEATDIGLSSLIDTWILLRDIELGGERNRAMYVLKSRGMAHSNQIREFLLTDRGIELREAYLGPQGVLTGSMRLAQEASERRERVAREIALQTLQRNLQRKRSALDAKVAALEQEFAQEQDELNNLIRQAELHAAEFAADRSRMAASRQVDANGNACESLQHDKTAD